MSERRPTIVVRGEARREVPPEQAVVIVTASARERERETVLVRLTERTAAVRTAVESFGEAVERRETGGVGLHPEIKRGGNRVVGYMGSVLTTVTVGDFAVLGDLLLRLGSLDGVSLDGPSWRLRPGSRAGAEVRRAAVDDAFTRAREYAEAVGARIDGLVEIADEHVGAAVPMMARNLSFSASASEADLSLELDPAAQTVHAAVIVRVTITEPTIPH